MKIQSISDAILLNKLIQKRQIDLLANTNDDAAVTHPYKGYLLKKQRKLEDIIEQSIIELG